MLTSAIFDMDGVIVDSHPAHIRTWKAFLLSLGKSVTDAELDFVRQGRKRQDILRYFLGELTDDQVIAHCHVKAVVTGDEVMLGKPHPEIFHKAARQMHVHPAESIVFEDSVSGIQAAKAAGMKCVGIADRQQVPALMHAGADYVFPNFSGLSWITVQKLFAM